MSKGASGLFAGTEGDRRGRGDAESTIASRVHGLDLRAHPVQRAQLSAAKIRRIEEKIKKRKATREEYATYMWNKRFAKRRRAGVRRFWKSERRRLSEGKAGTRNWTAVQRAAILAKKPVLYEGESLQAHHTYSAAMYPHLADRGEVIYPATKTEHLAGWHGGSFKKSLPGRRIRAINEF